jgi:hypothetical protein
VELPITPDAYVTHGPAPGNRSDASPIPCLTKP